MITDGNDMSPQDDFIGWRPGHDARPRMTIMDHPFPNPIDYTATALSPKYYSRWSVSPIEFMARNNLPWWLANVIKYTMRFDAKGGLQDLRKARVYLDVKIRELEGEARFWEVNE